MYIKLIEGVEIFEIVSHNDQRGYFREMLKLNSPLTMEGIAQISHSLVYTGVIKAWHAHKIQTQWNYVLNGLIFVALHDLRENSKTFGETYTFLAGDNYNPFVYKFPSGVAHGYKCINGPMNIIYFTSGVYDESEEVRIKYNDSKINFDWLKTEIK
jgi:dTDP-4-dehydrorhamnose 3,5-epimerase